MFAEDVELLPKNSFRDVLSRCKDDPDLFPRLVGQLWEAGKQMAVMMGQALTR